MLGCKLSTGAINSLFSAFIGILKPSFKCHKKVISFLTDKIPKAWGKKHVNLAFPSLNGTSFSQNFGAEKSAKTHGNSPQDVHLSTGNSAGKFHLSVIKISRVGQVGHGISTPLIP